MQDVRFRHLLCGEEKGQYRHDYYATAQAEQPCKYAGCNTGNQI